MTTITARSEGMLAEESVHAGENGGMFLSKASRVAKKHDVQENSIMISVTFYLDVTLMKLIEPLHNAC